MINTINCISACTKICSCRDASVSQVEKSAAGSKKENDFRLTSFMA